LFLVKYHKKANESLATSGGLLGTGFELFDCSNGVVREETGLDTSKMRIRIILDNSGSLYYASASAIKRQDYVYI
jgi:hypothetical protein